MRLTIIETGEAPEAIRDQFPDYPGMFQQMFDSVDAGIRCETVSVVRGEALPDPASLEGVLYTGSPAGVYEDHAWIPPLMQFIRASAGVRLPQIGICFGHQAMAEALGGKVEKSEKGWGVGRHRYDIRSAPGWTGAAPAGMNIAVSHQDQVIRKPDAADIVACSQFTEYAGLSYRGHRALSFQCHPEFTPDYAEALYTARRGKTLAEQEVEAAVASLEGACDRRFLAAWIAGFLKSAS